MTIKPIVASLLSAVMISSTNAALPELNLDIDTITVSGISSGGYMANQFHLSHSDWVKGAGIIAAGPYYCGQNDIKTALAECVNKTPENFSLRSLNAKVKGWAEQGKIADINNLKDSKVWLFHGTRDQKVITPVSDALHQQYQQWVGQTKLTYIKDKPFAHHFPTLDTGSDCGTSEPPFLGNCQYDAAGEMLSFLKGELSTRANSPQGELISFEQQSLGGEPASSLADKGYLYVPQSCQNGARCELHISFHGCNQNAQAVDTQFIEGNGLNNWADANHLVVLYPQTKSSLFMPLNPQGCWDWWGYTDEFYATRDGQQIQAVSNMVKQLAK